MKAIAATLLGLTLCAPVWAQHSGTITTGDLHDYCEAWARMETHPDQVTVTMLGNSSYLLGYIAGFTDATPDDLDLPKTQGELRAAVCKYIDLHPEIWKLKQGDGVRLALRALYGRTK